jgi:hypothetical protein
MAFSALRHGFGEFGKLGFQWRRRAGATKALASGSRRNAMYYYFLPLESMATAIQLASYLLMLVAATFAFLWVRP